jgi:ArsR family transcriptional regulator
MYSEQDLRVLKLFKCLSNGVRYKIIKLLADKSLCVNEIADIMNKKSENISQHLKIMKDLNIVSFITKNHNVFYSLKNRHILKVMEIMEKIIIRH